MKTSTPHHEASHKAESRPLPDPFKRASKRKGSIQHPSAILSRIFGWVAEGETLELMGLRSSVVLYCVHADLIGEVTLEELSAQAGIPQASVENLIRDFCRNIRWK